MSRGAKKDNQKLHEITYKKVSQQLRRGRPRHFDSAQQMLDECMEYFRWLDDNPLQLDNIVSDQGSPVRMPKLKQRAPTIGGMCLFLGISQRKWGAYRQSEDEDIRTICEIVDEMIRERKFAYGAASEFSARLISMDLGMTAKMSLEGGASPVRFQQIDKDMDPKEAAESYAATLGDE